MWARITRLEPSLVAGVEQHPVLRNPRGGREPAVTPSSSSRARGPGAPAPRRQPGSRPRHARARSGGGGALQTREELAVTPNLALAGQLRVDLGGSRIQA